MPTPPKPFTVLTNEKKSHRTKAELEQRRRGEAALSSGSALRERPEVRGSPDAHREFQRLNKLLQQIEKNDAIYEPVINRYCLLQAECLTFERMASEFRASRLELKEEYLTGGAAFDPDSGGLKPSEYYRLLAQMQRSIVDLDRQLQAKRKMLLDIERENIMTIAAALRSIPKKDDSAANPLLEALK